MRFWEYDEVRVYATIASCFVYALPRTLACSSHACCWGSTEWRMITWRSAYLVVSHLHPLTSEGARGREREIPEDLIHRLAVRSYKECLEPTANYVRTVYRKKKLFLKNTIVCMRLTTTELYYFSDEDQVIASRNCYPEMKKYILLNRVGFYRSRIL